MPEQDIGSVGKLEEGFSAGVASAKLSANLPQTAYGLKVSVSAEVDLDAPTLIGYLAAKIGGPIPEAVASFLESALKVA